MCFACGLPVYQVRQNWEILQLMFLVCSQHSHPLWGAQCLGLLSFSASSKMIQIWKRQALFYQPVNSFESHNYPFIFFALSLHRGMLHILRLLGAFEFDKMICSATTFCLSRVEVRKLLASRDIVLPFPAFLHRVQYIYSFSLSYFRQSKDLFHFCWNFLVSLCVGSELAAELGPCLSS